MLYAFQVVYALFKALVIPISALGDIAVTDTLQHKVHIVVTLHHGIVHVAHDARRIFGVGDVENPCVVGGVYDKGVVRHVVYKRKGLHLESLQVQ